MVHIVSYEWQGDLNDIHCEASEVSVIDGNLAKLAAKGVVQARMHGMYFYS